MSDYVSSSAKVTQQAISAQTSHICNQVDDSAFHSGSNERGHLDHASGYLGGDEEGAPTVEEMTADSQSDDDEAAAEEKNQAMADGSLVGGEVNGTPTAALAQDRIEEVADSENQTGRPMGNEEARRQVDAVESDSESTNQVGDEQEHYYDISNNLKRRRVFPFGRAIRARI